MKKYNKKILEIIRLLRKNSRIRLITISRRLGLSVIEVLRILYYLNKNIILKNVSILDYNKIGYYVHAFIIITLKNNLMLTKEEILKKDVLQEKEKSCYACKTKKCSSNNNKFYYQQYYHPISDLLMFLKNSLNVNTLSLSEKSIIVEVIFMSRDEYKIFIKKIREYDIIGLEEYIVKKEFFKEKFLT